MVFRRNRYLDLFAVMATKLRLEDRLDRADNFSPWKARIVLILHEWTMGNTD